MDTWNSPAIDGRFSGQLLLFPQLVKVDMSETGTLGNSL
jgi:hypothetical protein